MHHLILACPFARQIWYEVLHWLRLSCAPPDSETSLNDWWHMAWQHTPKPMRKGLATMTLLVLRMTWKHRNDCVFNDARPSIRALVHGIKEEAKLWATAGAAGLGVVLPPTWDVH